MVSSFYTHLLKAYENHSIKYRMKAWYGLTGMLAGFVFMSIALLSHLLLEPKPFLIIGDVFAVVSLSFGIFLLKKGYLSTSGSMFLLGAFSLLFVQTVIADGLFNDNSTSHIFHLFQTLGLGIICLMIYSLMATHRWQLFLGGSVMLLLLLLHVHAIRSNPLLDFGVGGVVITIVTILEFGFGFTAVILSFGLSNDLLLVNEQKSEFIEKQAITLKERAEALEAKNADLKIFAYSMSHDLKEPLRMIGSFTSLLKREISKDNWNEDSIKEYAQFAVDGSIKMEILINNLLTYIELSSIKEKPTWVNLERVVFGITQMNLKVLIEEKKAEINIEGADLVFACKFQLEKIFQNLISNAVKYTRVGVKPIVDIRVRNEQDGVYIDVSDNGIGIAIEQQNKIFEVFERVDNDSSYTGTGIGLAICRRVMDNHNGKISLSSEVGKGSTFHLFFPKPTAKVLGMKKEVA